MRYHHTHDRPLRTIAVAFSALAVVAAGASLGSDSARGTSLSQLNSELGATQSQVGSLTSSVSSLQSEIATLNGQIALVQGREAMIQGTLGVYQSRLESARASVEREHTHVLALKHRLAHARRILAQQLLSAYENAKPDLVSVILDARGFSQLLEQVDYLNDAEQQQQLTIEQAREAKRRAMTAISRLMRLERADSKLTSDTVTEADALAGMNALLGSREGAIDHARAAQQAALALARAHGAQLQQAISNEQAQQQAAAAAAAVGTQNDNSPNPALGPTDGWAVPYSVVLCESGAQNLPPNGAGASGYYQIIPGTWRQFGGSGTAAYLASKAEQDTVASRIWDGGAGASNWVCAGIVGIH